MRFILALFFNFILGLSGFSQLCSITGKVMLNVNNEYCENCNVQLTDITGINLLDYKYTDKKGTFQFDQIERNDYLIKIQFLGYHDTTILVNCNSTINNYQLDVILKILSIQIEEMSIIEKISYNRKSGDTTLFNLKVISKGNELSATEIITRIPGIYISGSKISYLGKVMSKILIDGLDISDNNHLSLTDNISYSSLENISVVNNYNDTGVEVVDSNKLGSVMLIKLKKGEKYKLQKSLNVKVGYPSNYFMESSFIKMYDKAGIRTHLSINNTDESIKKIEYSTLIEDIKRQNLFENNQTSLQMRLKMDETNLQESKGYKRNEHLIKIIGNVKNNKSFDLKLENQFFNSSSSSRQQIIDEFMFSQIRRSENSEGKISNLFWKSNNEISFLLYRKTNFRFVVPLIFESSKTEQIQQLSQSNNFISTENNVHNNVINLTPYYIIEHRFNDAFRMKILGTFNIQSKYENNFIGSNDINFLEAFLSKSSAILSLNSRFRAFQLDQQITTTIKLKKLQIIYNASIKSNLQNFCLDSPQDLFLDFWGKDSLSNSNFSQSIHSKFESQKLKFIFGLNGFISNVNYGGETLSFSRIRPYIFAMYKITNRWNFSSSFQSKIFDPNLMDLTILKFIQNSQFVKLGGIELGSREDKRTINLSLFRNYESGEKVWQFNSNLAIFLPYSTIVELPMNNETYLLLSHNIGKVINMIQSNLYVGRYLKNTKVTFRFQSENSNITTNGGIIDRKAKTLSLSLQIWYKNIAFHSAQNYSIYDIKGSHANTRTQSYNGLNEISYEYGRLKQHLNINLFYNKLEDNVVYNTLTYRLIFSPKNRKYEFSFILRNFLNIGDSKNANVINLSELNRYTEYQVQSGSIMGGFKILL